MIGDNPAARLLALLAAGSKENGDTNCRAIWYKLLDVERSNDPLLMSRLGKVMELPQQIIVIVEKDFPNQIHTCRHWNTQVNAAFMRQNLNGAWKAFNDHIDEHTLSYLSLSADLIQTKSPTSLLEESTIIELREKLDSILNELIEGEFDIGFKEYLGRYLQRIIVSIDEYRISGSVPIIESVEIAFGHSFFDEKYRAEISNTEFGNKVVTVLSAVASAVTIALGAPQLPQSFQHLLEKINENT